MPSNWAAADWLPLDRFSASATISSVPSFKVGNSPKNVIMGVFSGSDFLRTALPPFRETWDLNASRERILDVCLLTASKIMDRNSLTFPGKEYVLKSVTSSLGGVGFFLLMARDASAKK